jgi:hypothetical protein
MVFLGQMRGLPAIAKAAEVPNAVQSFGTTWQQSGQPQFRRLWLARFTRTYPTVTRRSCHRGEACTRRVQFVLDALFFIAHDLRDIHPCSCLWPGKAQWTQLMARLGNCISNIWHLLAMRLSYNGHKPGLWALYSSKGSRVHGRKPEKRAVKASFGTPHLCVTLRHVLGIASYSPNGVLEANVWRTRPVH